MNELTRAVGVLGDEASMIKHVLLHTGIALIPHPTYPEPERTAPVWTERTWTRWNRAPSPRSWVR